jgi:hypothetical protein
MGEKPSITVRARHNREPDPAAVSAGMTANMSLGVSVRRNAVVHP